MSFIFHSLEEKMISSEEVRKLFLSFFQTRGHKIIPSSSLIPYDDPSVLLTTAGMQQFKKYFTRQKDPMVDFGSQRVASIQKCFRTTDIDEIGDPTHLTFFEMLGNFSFGPIGKDDPKEFGKDGYFKKSAIYWAYEFISQLGLKIDYVTIFEGEKNIPLDNESYRIWEEIGFSSEKIKRRGREDNFWGPTGEEGPCGPTTEIYVNDVEIWNLVFNEYYQDRDGNLSKLEFSGVDTGMGFERLMKSLQNTETIFETDLFQPTRTILENSIKNYDIRRQRIVMDHLRGSVFLVADGLYPSNLERGYILRRILRRLTVNMYFLGIRVDSLENLLKSVVEKYLPFYSELKNFVKIKEVILNEINNFERVLNSSIKEFNKKFRESDSSETIGEKMFFLYTSHGLPLDIGKEILMSKGRQWDRFAQQRFEDLFKKHQLISKGKNE
ncbi:MAG: alanine--tRNA ligase-related protein [Patescibacteria group bacterium]|nr:alanine--tRNA ligase-related protein [Patescibacteria group bacterium]